MSIIERDVENRNTYDLLLGEDWRQAIGKEATFSDGQRRIVVTTGHQSSGNNIAYSYDYRTIRFQNVSTDGSKAGTVIAREDRYLTEFNKPQGTYIRLDAIAEGHNTSGRSTALTSVEYPYDGEMRGHGGINRVISTYAEGQEGRKLTDGMHTYEGLLESFPVIDMQTTADEILLRAQQRNLQAPEFILPSTNKAA